MVYLLLDSGLLPTLFAEDYSFVSRAILSIYLFASLQVMLVSHRLSIEIRDVNTEASIQRGIKSPKSSVDHKAG